MAAKMATCPACGKVFEIPKGKPGRPKGSKNAPKPPIEAPQTPTESE